MNESHRHDPEGLSILRNGLWCVSLAAAFVLLYAFNIESSLFRAVALQLCLCGVVIWASMDATKLRRRLNEIEPHDKLSYRREAEAIHYLYVAAPLMAILVFTGLSMIAQSVEVAFPRTQQQVIAGAILAILAASLWTVFTRMLEHRADAEEDPDSRSDTSPYARESLAVRAAFSESRFAALLTGGGLMAATIHAPVENWLAWLLSLWTFVVALEQLLRTFAAWFQATTLERPFTSPIDSLLREIFLSSFNPLAKAFDIFEARYGLSIRSSWTIVFFRRSVAPISLSCLLVVWLSTCFVVVQPHQAGLEMRFGVAQRSRLAPGLHTKLPWPFGEIRRYPAGIVQTMQIGFEEEAKLDVSEDKDRTLLWTQPHAKEFALVLGSETELVAVNAVVYFQIAEDTQGFLNHAFASSNPQVALKSLAYRVLMEQTRVATLEDLLSRGRDQFAEVVRDQLNEYASEEKLGLEVIDVALINLHPPVEVADSYLDVINAELDSDRVVTVANGEAATQILKAQEGSDGRLATARIDAEARVSVARQESSEFVAVGEAYTADPVIYRLRLWFEAFEKVLFGRRLFVIDSELPDVIFDDRAKSAEPLMIETSRTNNP